MKTPRQQRRYTGQSLVEFGFALPVFLLLIAGVVEGARLVYSVATLNHAVQEAGRVGALETTGNAADVVVAVNNAAAMLTVQSVTVTVNGGSKTFTERDLGDRLTVSAQTFYTPVFGGALGNWAAIPISAQTEIMVE